MPDLVELYRRAVEEFGRRVQAVTPEQWHLETPCADWDVRQLVNHVLGENAWLVPLLAGSTIDEVGDHLNGDLLGDDPVAAWANAAAAATAAAEGEGVLERVVHVSFGDIPGREYLSQIITDHVIHSWDLARAVGGDERLDPEVVEFANGYLEPQAEQWRAAGAFGARVDVRPAAGAQERLLALTGRGA